MLGAKQLYEFKTFGFMIMRKALSDEEIKTIKMEFDARATDASGYDPFDGTKGHNLNMLGNRSPFHTSLLEDPRFAGTATQIFGEVLGQSAHGNRYVKNTSWHCDAGSYEGHGVKFAMYLQPVGANTGALRVIPGSHKRPWFDELDEQPPLRYAWARQDFTRAEADDVIESIPGFVCETKPGDVVAFDLRIYHASLGGSSDRQMCTLVYKNYPKTPQEVAATITEAKTFLAETDNSSNQWNPPRAVPDEWLANPDGSTMRQRWIDEWMRFSKMTAGENGYTTVAIDGKIKVQSI